MSKLLGHGKDYSENHILHNILQSGCIDTHMKRNMLIKNHLKVVQQKRYTLAKMVKKKTVTLLTIIQVKYFKDFLKTLQYKTVSVFSLKNFRI